MTDIRSACYLLCVGVILGLGVFQEHVIAQPGPGTIPPLAPVNQNRQTPALLPRAINGAVTPSEIPENVAYRLIFLDLAEPPMPSESQKRRQQAKISSIGLADLDVQLLILTLSDFRRDNEDIKSRTNHLAQVGQLSSKAIQELTAERDALISRTQTTLFQDLSPLGQQRLRIYVEKAKSRMVHVPSTH